MLKVILIFIFGIGFSMAMDTSHPLSQVPLMESVDSEENILKDLKDMLEKEKDPKIRMDPKLRGPFMRGIIKNLKTCTQGNVIALNYLSIKSSYWWDKHAPNFNSSALNTPDYNDRKDLIIDRKFRSSVYDREGAIQNAELASLLYKYSQITSDKYFDSWQSVKEKMKFFDNKDISGPTGSIKDKKGDSILDYGKASMNQGLDTYPSVYQLIKAAKTLKYEDKEAHTCPRDLGEFGKTPSEIISNVINELSNKPFFVKFSKQNHPLSKIVQGHLKKLSYKAKSGGFFNQKRVNDDEMNYNKNIVFKNIMFNIEKMIRFMSIFDIDMTQDRCKISGLKQGDAYYLYAQFYEIINDLLFLMMSLDQPYEKGDFQRILSQNYTSRIPILDKLNQNPDIFIQSYPMRSGMDAFVNASMAIGYMPQDVAIAPKVANLENTVYYEVNSLIKQFRDNHTLDSNLFVSLNRKVTDVDVDDIKDELVMSYIKEQNKSRLKEIKSKEENERKKGDYEKNKKLVIEKFEEEPFMASFVTFNYHIDESIFDINPDKTFKEIENEVKDKILDQLAHEVLIEIKKTDIYKTLFNVVNYGDNYYLLLNKDLDLGARQKIKSLFKSDIENKFPDIVDEIFVIDNHPSITSGMTTDTIDQSSNKETVDKLYRKMEKIRSLKKALFPSVQPFVFLWDTTLEIDQGMCYAMIEKYQGEIQSGKVIFILFKSLQKYANLGIGKTKAGVTTVIGKKESITEINQKLEKYAQDVWNHHREELQLMTYFYDRFTPNGHVLFDDNEQFYYNAVCDQAKKVNQFAKLEISGGCLFGRPGHWGLPNVPYADTFGFCIPTFTEIENGLVRISVGLNPEGLK